MASRINRSSRSFVLLLLGAGVLFGILVTKHYEITPRTVREMSASVQNAATIAAAQAGVIEPCAVGTDLVVFSPTVYICDEPSDELVYDDIYHQYPATADGRELMYSFIAEGEKSRADEMLQDVYNLERYEAVTLTTPLSWTDDPFDERYWRFIFYSLRPLRHLLATAEETGAERYYDKTREILQSFLDVGMEQEHAWDDAHGVSFRTMVLVNAWWKLREAGELPSSLSDDLLGALEVHGNFLLDPANYEDDYNHAITQSAALLLLAENFPDLANAQAWRETAIRRIDIGLSSIIDPNGVLVENSPFYHFYVLEKYWEIHRYAEANSIEVSEEFNDKMEQMVRFASYVLRPDQSVPLLGASSPRTILRSGVYREIAETYPTFDYVVTGGTSGERPEETSVLFPSSGIALLRSGWGTERPYEDETHVLFDVGPYRTDHSDLDALTVSLFSYGAPIIRDAGLFTYETEHPLYRYFYGTYGHNTIVVDGQDQTEGSAEYDELEEGNGYVYLGGWHDLYPGVRHSRTVVLLGHDALLILDSISSDTEHTYEQLVHLPPEAELEGDVGRVTRGINGDVSFSIEQLVPFDESIAWRGSEDPFRGHCATAYEERTPCYELAYTTTAPRAQYVTLIQFGEIPYEASYRDGVVHLVRTDTTYAIDIEFPDEGVFESAAIGVSIDVDDTSEQSVVERIGTFFRNLF